MIIARLGRALTVVLCIAASACHTVPPQFNEPTPVARSDWQAALAQSSAEAAAGRHAVADRVLADFAAKFPASNEATESMFWRALYRMDPANPAMGTRDAMILLDGYAQAPQALHKSEGMVLRRLAVAIETRSTASVLPSPVAAAPRPDDKAKDDELVRLKDELAKTTAELERIKRRLAAPKP